MRKSNERMIAEAAAERNGPAVEKLIACGGFSARKLWKMLRTGERAFISDYASDGGERVNYSDLKDRASEVFSRGVKCRRKI